MTFTVHCDKCGKDFVHTEGTGTDQHIICDDCLAKMRMKKEPVHSQQATFEGGIKK